MSVKKLSPMFVLIFWGILGMAEIMAIFVVLELWGDVQMKQLGLMDLNADELLKKLLLGCFVMAFMLLGLTGVFFLRQYEDCKIQCRRSIVQENHVVQDSEDTVASLHVSIESNTLEYAGRSCGLPHRAAVFLDALLKSEDHILNVDDFDRLYGKGYYDGTDSGKIRGIKYHVCKALKEVEAPFNVVKGLDGGFSLLPKGRSC